MVQKGTYTEFLKSGIDFGSLLKKENEEAEPSPVPGSPPLRNRTFSESSVWSQQSSRPSLKEATPEGQDVSFSSWSMPGSVAIGGLMDLQSALFMTSLCSKEDTKFPRLCSIKLIELKQHAGSQPDSASPFGVGWRQVLVVLLWLAWCMWDWQWNSCYHS